MDSLFRGLNDESGSSRLNIFRCPFLGNINEPTNISFSSTFPLPMLVRRAKGPIFEDGPNFDMAFKLFHENDGVVPLSERSFAHSETAKSKVSAAPLHFNPLAAKVATISLSAFGPGGPFGFDSFSEK